MEEGGFTVVMPSVKNGKTATDGVNSMPIATKDYIPKEMALDPLYTNK